MVSRHTKLLFGASFWVLFASGTFLQGVEGSHISKLPFPFRINILICVICVKYVNQLTRTVKFLVVVWSEVLSLTKTLATTWKTGAFQFRYSKENYDLPKLG